MNENVKFIDVMIDETDRQKVTTTLPTAVRGYIASKGYKLNDLIRLGTLAKEDNPQLISRLKLIEEKYTKIENILFDLKEKVSIILEIVS